MHWTSVCLGLVAALVVCSGQIVCSHIGEVVHNTGAATQVNTNGNNYSIPAYALQQLQLQQQQQQQQIPQMAAATAKATASSARGLIDEQLMKTVGKLMGITEAPEKAHEGNDASGGTNQMDIGAPLMGMAKSVEAAANFGKMLGTFNEARNALMGAGGQQTQVDARSGANTGTSAGTGIGGIIGLATGSPSASASDSASQPNTDKQQAANNRQHDELIKDKDDRDKDVTTRSFGKLMLDLIEAYKSPAAFKLFVERQLRQASADVRHHFDGLFRALLKPVQVWVRLLEKVMPPDACKLRNVCKLGQHLQHYRSSLTLVPAHMFDDSRYFRALSDGILGDTCAEGEQYAKCKELELPMVHFFKTLLGPLHAFVESNPIVHALSSFFESIAALFGLPPIAHHDVLHLDSLAHTMGVSSELPTTPTTTGSSGSSASSGSGASMSTGTSSGSGSSANSNSNSYGSSAKNTNDDEESYGGNLDANNYADSVSRARRATNANKKRTRRDAERQRDPSTSVADSGRGSTAVDDERLLDHHEHLLEVLLKRQPELYEHVKQWRQHEPLKTVHHFSNQLYSKIRPWERKACKFADAHKWNPMCNGRLPEELPKLPPFPKFDNIWAPFQQFGIGGGTATSPSPQSQQHHDKPQTK